MSIHSISYKGTTSITLDRPYNYTSSTSPTIYLGVSTPITYYLTILVLNLKYTSNTYYNYSKVGYYLPNYTLPYALYIELKEL